MGSDDDKQTRIRRAVLKAVTQMKPSLLGDSAPDADQRSIALYDNLDSLGMVDLIISVEQELKREFEREVPILGKAGILNADPFKTTGTLMDHIARLL